MRPFFILWSSWRKGKVHNGLFAALAAFTLAYLFLRMVRIPITHDEAGTILNFAQQPLWDILTYKDPIPNNHIFNTLLVKGSHAVFGLAEWACRWPNLMAGALYILYGFLLLRLLTGIHNFKSIAGIILLLGNPYLLEFFALARGYGLSVGLMMASLYYIQRGKLRDHWFSLGFAALAVYANLTLLNYFIPLLTLVLFLRWKDSLKDYLRSILPALVISLVLTGLLALPVIRMIGTDQFRFWGTKGFMADTLEPLLRSSLMGEAYFGTWTGTLFTVILVVSGILLFLYAIRMLWKRRFKAMHQPRFQLLFLFFGTLFYNILQHHIAGVPYLNARTALFFYPLYCLALLAILTEEKGFPRVKSALIVVLTGFSIWHMSRTWNLHSSREWWFDGDNRKVMEWIASDTAGRPDDKASLKCNWLFQPSLTYYVKTRYADVTGLPPYNKTIDTSELVDYYYITSDDRNAWFDRHYVVAQSFAWDSRFLMKKKPLKE